LSVDVLDQAIDSSVISFVSKLSPDERDVFKHQLSLASTRELENGFEVSRDPEKRTRFSRYLRQITAIQPFRERVPEFGIVYRGRPNFMTDSLVQDLRNESIRFRPHARMNLKQLIFQVDTPKEDTVSECLAESDELHRFVAQHAGPCFQSFITSYIYYDFAGQCSEPHVDNAFTSITAMVGLRNDHADPAAPTSSSIVYWPDRAPMEFGLEPGEMAIFFGVCVLHGRTPIGTGDSVHSLLLSFRPKIDNAENAISLY
jgi:hypothetical protein